MEHTRASMHTQERGEEGCACRFSWRAAGEEAVHTPQYKSTHTLEKIEDKRTLVLVLVIVWMVVVACLWASPHGRERDKPFRS